VPSDSYLSLPVSAILRQYNWNLVAVVCEADKVAAKDKMVSELKAEGYTISSETLVESVPEDKAAFFQAIFKKIKETARGKYVN